jgi:hypothetical protein
MNILSVQLFLRFFFLVAKAFQHEFRIKFVKLELLYEIHILL